MDVEAKLEPFSSDANSPGAVYSAPLAWLM